MGYLIGVTLLWSLSYSLVGEFLSGNVDNYFSVLTRILLATLVFAPFLQWRQPDRHGAAGPPVPARFVIQLMLIGGAQLGLMYIFYYQSFLLLSVPEVLVFSILTPFYITLIYDALDRRFRGYNLLVALVAILGAAVIRWDRFSGDFWLGFWIVQASNICMAAGQVGYKRLMEKDHVRLPPRATFGWFFVGALLVASVAWLALGEPLYPTRWTQWVVLLWLGLVASGMGFFLWNKGATRVDPGVLAVMNNALIPAGIVVNLVFWNQSADMGRLLAGTMIIIAALLLHRQLYRRWPAA
jgi:carboxylate/amino acid/amine transporter